VKAHPKSFDLVKIWAKSRKIREKSGKIREKSLKTFTNSQHALTAKNRAQNDMKSRPK